MDRIDEFSKLMEGIDYYINNPLDFIYEKLEDPTLGEIIECMRYIAYNNNIAVMSKTEYLASLHKHIEEARPLQDFIPQVEEAPKIESPSNPVAKPKDISEEIEYITYCNFDTELSLFLDTLSKEEIIRLKLEFLKHILLLKKMIKEFAIETPTADLSNMQEELKIYEEILSRIKEYGRRQEVTTTTETQQISNIILLPNAKTSYLLQDIAGYQDYSKEIKIAFDKIIEGYFLQTKDLKAIRGMKENLFEYTHPNGLRILYIVKNNLILICSLFFKDKKKSTKISSEYDEAQNRFYASIDYVLENIDNPDFYIEQAELIAQIYTYLENHMSYTKKVGDSNE